MAAATARAIHFIFITKSPFSECRNKRNCIIEIVPFQAERDETQYEELAEITKSGLAQDCVADLEDRFLQKEKTVSPQ